MNSGVENAWHRWINQTVGGERGEQYASIYDYKGSLHTLPVIQSHLTTGKSATCWLGKDIQTCPILQSLRASLDDDPISKDKPDADKILAMAHTCLWHLLDATYKGVCVDWNEGAVQTADDRAFWDGVYRSMSSDQD